MIKKPPRILVTGMTACGKTALAYKIAEVCRAAGLAVEVVDDGYAQRCPDACLAMLARELDGPVSIATGRVDVGNEAVRVN